MDKVPTATSLLCRWCTHVQDCQRLSRDVSVYMSLEARTGAEDVHSCVLACLGHPGTQPVAS